MTSVQKGIKIAIIIIATRPLSPPTFGVLSTLSYRRTRMRTTKATARTTRGMMMMMVTTKTTTATTICVVRSVDCQFSSRSVCVLSSRRRLSQLSSSPGCGCGCGCGCDCWSLVALYTFCLLVVLLLVHAASAQEEERRALDRCRHSLPSRAAYYQSRCSHTHMSTSREGHNADSERLSSAYRCGDLHDWERDRVPLLLRHHSRRAASLSIREK